MEPGKFITFEGGEGAGKTTQIKLLSKKFEEEGIDYIVTREPGGTPLADELRKIVKHSPHNMDAMTEYFLFSAARRNHVSELILPALEKGFHVISDRYVDSSTVYQGFAGGLDLDEISYINRLATSNLNPDLTLILDVDYNEGVENALSQARFERKGSEYHEKVNNAFLYLPRHFPERNIQIIFRDTIEKMSEKIYEEVKKII